MQAIEADLGHVTLDGEGSVRSGEEDGDGRPESCMTSTITEAEVRSRLEDVRSFSYANGKDGEYSKTAYLLSRTVHRSLIKPKAREERRRGGGAGYSSRVGRSIA